jgi:hypothetical protein
VDKEILPDEFTVGVLALAKNYNLSLPDIQKKLVFLFNPPKDKRKDSAKKVKINNASKIKLPEKEVAKLDLDAQCFS